ncbi:ThiF family adenylyltransferase [Aquimarina algiphila]|uniref:ThiF family adenylyltransferase n=1 Tax=Aquimarina algiphila TaxID=2047982 RepID=UPI00232AFB35|nr:ThiF family adenylyltransferase [Aquimarina algiphila]
MKYSVSMTESVNKELFEHLIRQDGQEDLCFAFYRLSTGKTRKTGVINDIILPEFDDRNVHGNVSFNSSYFDKVTSYALANNLGICFIHSHPYPGWQGMSFDDIEAEKMLAPRVKAVAGLPLIGMTIGTDNYWSARFWIKEAPNTYKRYWCESVRVVGKSLKPYFYDEEIPKSNFGEEFKRTISAWGDMKQQDISRLKIGIVGLGSVGSIVAEALLRTGVKNLTLIDFDLVERKNLDRLLAINRIDVDKYKVDIVKERLLRTQLISDLNVNSVQYSITEKEGQEAALDCDILFSCVDMPLPRYSLDCLSFANLIPVIDGGIDTNSNKDLTNIDQARWKAHTIGPERICMQCLGQYKPEDAALELSGELDNPYYIKGLQENHFINRGENVFGFSLSLAGMEIQQFL